jgi:hypothetical protein
MFSCVVSLELLNIADSEIAGWLSDRIGVEGVPYDALFPAKPENQDEEDKPAHSTYASMTLCPKWLLKVQLLLDATEGRCTTKVCGR